MIKYIFMTIGELARYLEAHPGKEVGFTDDTKENLKYNREPTEWHGVSVTDIFDGKSLICGYYGEGIDFGRSIDDLCDVIDGLVEYCKDYLHFKKINTDTKICVCKEDLI